MADEIIIKNKEQFDKIMAERRKKSDLRQVREDAVTTYDHKKVACQVIKVINSINIDPFVKKVMTLRVLGPMVTGQERSHMSIALELGATVDDVEQAEAYGVACVNTMLEKVSLPDFIGKYNCDRAVRNAVKGVIEQGNSDTSESQQEK
jgi:hypothetical protein